MRYFIIFFCIYALFFDGADAQDRVEYNLYKKHVCKCTGFCAEPLISVDKLFDLAFKEHHIEQRHYSYIIKEATNVFEAPVACRVHRRLFLEKRKIMKPEERFLMLC